MNSISDVDTAINWYRTPLSREKLSALNARSDAKGLLQCLTVLAILAATGTATLWAAFRDHWMIVPLLLFLHGTVGSFHINAVHELCHNSVFKTKALNSLFIRIFGFLGWNDWVWFNASHANHHRYTLHPPRDGEVVLPLSWINPKNFWKAAIWQPLGPFFIIRGTLRRARGCGAMTGRAASFLQTNPMGGGSSCAGTGPCCLGMPPFCWDRLWQVWSRGGGHGCWYPMWYRSVRHMGHGCIGPATKPST